MCGIVGYLGENHYTEYILTGLRLLLNRGYDSVGISTIYNNEINTTKYASVNTCDSLDILEKNIKIRELETSDRKQTIGIGHTRWATHGAKTQINAHPHSDNNNRISLVHNGIIENFYELKTELLNSGYTLKSQTDTEVIAVLIGKYLDEKYTISDAIEKAVQQLSGTWALVIIHCDYPNKLWLTRNGSPLLLGFDDEYIMVASEQIAFSTYIKKYIVLDNHDIIEVTKEEKQFVYNNDIRRYPIKTKIDDIVEVKPLEFPYWMLKEIKEQQTCINRALNNGGRIQNDSCVKLGGLDNYTTELLEVKHLIILGCGTSYHAGLWSLTLFKSIDVFDTVTIYDGAEFNAKDIPRNGKTAVIFLSQSGETKDLHRCIDIAKEKDLVKIGVVNVVDSMIARETDCGIYLNAGRELAVASTKSFTNQCVVLSMISIWFSQKHGTMSERRKQMIIDLRNLPFHIQNVLNQFEDESLHTQISKWIESKTVFILGKGSQEAIAKEGALKIKEIAYIHAEGYSSSALKHGTFALIEPELPVIILDIGEEHRDKNRNAYQEILTRNADILMIHDDVDNDNNHFSNELIVDKNPTFGGLLANVFLQMISYKLSVLKGYNPDFPRNLAKVVTVE